MDLKDVTFGAFALCLTMLTGCAGWIEEGLPTLRDKFDRTCRVQLLTPSNGAGNRLYARGADRVEEAFVKALDKRGIRHSVFTNGCDIVLFVTITGWEYNSEGFAGEGRRDDVRMDVLVRDLKTRRVKTRASLEARKLDELVDDYIERLFRNPEDDD